jgi:hypothetical protein
VIKFIIDVFSLVNFPFLSRYIFASNNSEPPDDQNIQVFHNSEPPDDQNIQVSHNSEPPDDQNIQLSHNSEPPNDQNIQGVSWTLLHGQVYSIQPYQICQ